MKRRITDYTETSGHYREVKDAYPDKSGISLAAGSKKDSSGGKSGDSDRAGPHSPGNRPKPTGPKEGGGSGGQGGGSGGGRGGFPDRESGGSGGGGRRI